MGVSHMGTSGREDPGERTETKDREQWKAFGFSVPF